MNIVLKVIVTITMCVWFSNYNWLDTRKKLKNKLSEDTMTLIAGETIKAGDLVYLRSDLVKNFNNVVF